MVSMIWEMYWRREPSHYVKIIRHDISIVEKHMGDMAAMHYVMTILMKMKPKRIY